jgi:hypothetical protein
MQAWARLERFFPFSPTQKKKGENLVILSPFRPFVEKNAPRKEGRASA